MQRIRDYLPLPRRQIKIMAIIVTNRVGQFSKTITKAISNSWKVSLNALICAAEGIPLLIVGLSKFTFIYKNEASQPRHYIQITKIDNLEGFSLPAGC